MGRKLAQYVTVHSEAESVTYGPGDDVPAEHAKLITNPKAWGDDDEPKQAHRKPAAKDE